VGSFRLLPASSEQLLQMMQWFPSRESCVVWGGRDFRFPFSADTFRADCRFLELPSYAMTVSAELCGFGQYYARAGRCHLARLAVAPSHRGRGCGTWLIGQLMQIGTRELRVSECSLYVSVSNVAAIALYERLGFARAPHPEATAESFTSYYMVRALPLRA
jgi:ribosomal protein S18 acetylase RimI-like enzyme